MSYAELHCRSNFSFLAAASHPEELVLRASELHPPVHCTALSTEDKTDAGRSRLNSCTRKLDTASLRSTASSTPACH